MKRISEAFKAAFEIKCAELISKAYKSIVNKGIDCSNLDENDITALIEREIKNNPQRLEWYITNSREYHLDDNRQLNKGMAAKFPRIDMRFVTINSKKEYEYFFEAKNLKETDSASKKRYIDTGIDNFITQKYQNGSLIGYLIEGTPIGAIQGINVLLIKDGRVGECLEQMEVEFHCDFFQSNHPNLFRLQHYIFDFSNRNK